MKLLLIHLSDAHLKDKTYIDENIINAQVQAINSLGEFEKCCIVFSGDLAHSGQENEYKKGRIFLGKLWRKLTDKFNLLYPINTLIVPGNHDIDFNGQRRNRSEVCEIINSGITDEMISKELEKFQNFYAIAEFYKCFSFNKLELCKDNLIFPMIVFDNPNIINYKRIIIDGELKINVFKLDDYESMMKAIIHPYDIIYYLQERVNWIQDYNLPNIIIGDGEHSTIFATIKTEEDFASFFKQFIYEGQSNKQREALRHLALIATFRERLIKKVPNYKTILNILELIEPRVADEFMARFDYAWKCACDDKFDFTKSIQVQYNGKKTDIVFFSVGRKELSSKEYYRVLCDAKQLQHKSDAVLIFAFIGDGGNGCHNDWCYMEKEYKSAEDALKFYESIGMFDGTMDYEIYEELCKKCLNQ